MNKCYVVGCGIVGSVIAHELAENGFHVTIFERRDHVGGNLYDYTDEHGIHVHLYGPHIFHTNSERVWSYVSEKCELKEYNLVCGAVINGKCVSTAFDFSAVDAFFPEEASVIKDHIKETFQGKSKASILEMLDSSDAYVKKFAEFLYKNDYEPYTAKQWGISPDEIDRSIFERVPVLFSYGSKYFDDRYQAIPVNGYTELIENLINHKNITVSTNTEALHHISLKNKTLYIDGKEDGGTVFYTGPIDELFHCCFGKLPYRSLRFEWKYEEKDSLQDMPVVAYPQAGGYTRITEYKKLPYQNVKGTSYAVEYPIPYHAEQSHEPYYPVITDESKQLYGKYEALSKQISGLICCGRLADFKYYNIDQAIERALDAVQEFLI